MAEAPGDLAVTVGLLDGSTRRGWLASFDPLASTVSLDPRARSASGPLGPTEIPAPEVAYLAFDRPPHVSPTAPADTAPRFRIHAAGGKTFLVRIAAPEMERSLGFFAAPVDPADPVARYFFYPQGVNRREEDEPLGVILVRDGALAESDVRRGLAVQSGTRPQLGDLLLEEKEIDAAGLARAQLLQQRRKQRIGEVLVETGLVTQEAVERALAEQRKHGGKRLGEIMVELGMLTEDKLARTLAEKFFLGFVDLEEQKIQTSAIDEVGRELIEKHRVLPIASDDETLTVAISDPLAMEGIDALRFRFGKQIREVVATPSQLREFIELYVGRKTDEHSDFERILREFQDSDLMPLESSSEDEREPNALDHGVVKLVNQIVADAIRRGASDVHIEPNGRERKTVVRFRVDGECQPYQEVPATLRRALVARVKIIAGLDIAERRKPQDGKTRFRLGRETIEVRVATLPTGDGDEDAVLRILTSTRAVAIGELGLSTRNRRVLLEALQQPYGLLLCVGPTGSGKTTTLHAMLGHLNSVDRKIWTAEDPIEITQPGLRQLQVRPKIGLTFAAALRSFLRADPDVIMVGEMRDEETATVAVEASLTGHLVLSTLHTNGAPETVTRLLEMGIEPFSFADALVGVLAQRLVRGLCSACREAYEPSAEEQGHLSSLIGAEDLALALAEGSEGPRLWRGRGCDACGMRGYQGRLPIHELLISNADIVRAIQRKAPASEVRALGEVGGMRSLLHDGLRKAVAGLTDLKQVLSAASH